MKNKDTNNGFVCFWLNKISGQQKISNTTKNVCSHIYKFVICMGKKNGLRVAYFVVYKMLSKSHHKNAQVCPNFILIEREVK